MNDAVLGCEYFLYLQMIEHHKIAVRDFDNFLRVQCI
jgi:hypothetical protein